MPDPTLWEGSRGRIRHRAGHRPPRQDERETHHPGGDSQIKILLEQFSATAYVFDDMNFTPPYLSLIKCPTLIVHGDNDGFFPIEIPVEMHKAIPNSFLWIIPNGEHLPVWNTLWSDKFLEVSKLFLADKF